MNNSTWIIAGGATAVLLAADLVTRQLLQPSPRTEETRAEETRMTQSA